MSKRFLTNSDHKGRQQWEIHQRSENPDVRGVKVDGREIPWIAGSRMAKVSDRGLAERIHYDQGQGGSGDVVVIPVERGSDAGHVRTFTVPELPWKKKDK